MMNYEDKIIQKILNSNNGEMYSEVITITPELAAKLLKEFNYNNRNINEIRARLYAEQMKAGKWRLTHQGIAFAKNGHLIDGQHRLEAVVRANIPVDMWVFFNCQNNSIGVDDGRGRKIAEHMYFEFGDSNIKIRNPSLLSMINFLISYYLGRYTVTTTDRAIAFFEKYPKETDYIYSIVCSSKKRALRGAKRSAILAACFAAIICKENPDAVRAFYDALSDLKISDSSYNYDSAFSLHKILLKDSETSHRIDDSALYNLTQNAIWNFIHGGAKILRKTTVLKYNIANEMNDFK